MNELGIQTELVKATIAAGGYAFKMSNRFLVGVPDLFIQLPRLPTVLLEVKYQPHPKKVRPPVKVTPHQAHKISKINDVGGVAGCIMVTRLGLGEYNWCAGRWFISQTGLVRVGADRPRYKGQPWPIEAIIKEIALCS